MKDLWKPVIPSSNSNIEKAKQPLKIPHKLGHIPSFCKNKDTIAKSKFLLPAKNG
jgi:hypothetical protein